MIDGTDTLYGNFGLKGAGVLKAPEWGRVAVHVTYGSEGRAVLLTARLMGAQEKYDAVWEPLEVIVRVR
jgi:hypothetical protein